MAGGKGENKKHVTKKNPPFRRPYLPLKPGHLNNQYRDRSDIKSAFH
jgi:hypothetical protein